MIREQLENFAHWSTDGSGVVQFRYDIDHLKFVFNVRPYTIHEVIRDITRLADDNSSPMTHGDAKYLTKLILDVMDMQAYPEELCNCEQCVGNHPEDFAWTVTMFACSAVIITTTAVFLLWGL